MLDVIKNCRRVVVKAGASILTAREGSFSLSHLVRLGSGIMSLVHGKKDVVLVSSGAIALGMEIQAYEKRPREIAMLQACAAIGQGKLMHAYEQYFSKRGLHTAQLLLTRDGLEDRSRFLKARRTLEELLKMKVLPIVNENDTVATEEIAFGDNDVLSVQVAHLIHADLLVILSDVDGFYLRDGSRIRQVSSESEIDQVLMKHLKDKVTSKTVGGMKAKLEAAKVAMRLGVALLIVNGHRPDVMAGILAGEDMGTLFIPGRDRRNARKKWIAFSAKRRGSLVIDQGACQALTGEKRSLLASGILRSEGNFKRGDVVELKTPEGRVFGRGVVHYASDEISRISGKKSAKIKEILGYKYEDEVIHRNDLVLWG